MGQAVLLLAMLTSGLCICRHLVQLHGLNFNQASARTQLLKVLTQLLGTRFACHLRHGIWNAAVMLAKFDLTWGFLLLLDTARVVST